MKIRITEEDIRLGIRYSRSLCPIARSLNRQRGPAWHVHEDYVIQKTLIPDYHKLTYEAVIFINRFDGGADIQPCILKVWED